jgi:hypothetical protein
MNLQNLKNLFLKLLIGCLVVAAALAVVTVIIGHFNDIFAKALFTILLVALHCLISFGFIVNNEKEETFENLTFFTNVTFFIIVLSFITSILGVWTLLSGALVAKLYALYFVLLFATLHGETLSKTTGKQKNIDTTVSVNYFFMAIVVLMLLPVIFLNDNSSLPSIYYRSLAAAGIIDATLTLIAVILHKLYVQKHPTLTDNVFNLQQIPGQPGQNMQNAQIAAAAPKHGMNIFVKILLGYVILQVIGSVFVMVLGAFALHH